MLVRTVGHVIHIAQNAMEVISSNAQHAEKDILKLIKRQDASRFALLDYMEILRHNLAVQTQ
jgi:chemotaxis signal transduction protein